MKKRRARRSEPKDWVKEISKGNVNVFYKSTDWDIVREKALMRDKNVCQFFIGKWHDDKHRPKQLEVRRANTVHHIIPIRKCPELCLDLDNLVSLSFEAHEIIEERKQHRFKPKKKITQERW